MTRPAVDVPDLVRTHFSEVLAITIAPEDMSRTITGLARVDSLRFVQGVSGLEKRLGIQLDEDELFDVRTLDDLCTLVQRALP
ncbi:acyl carrier protein [Nocardia mexicana]|uniref:Acyl carrier protein n=1 Tax=Nocardia mexicana TaxID=279262 RepID=A0A370H3F4_9NOCA|nr:acyl carrier protein [Nocardia mexicana]RDI50745.1 acyl carrier protein [Nocardia mexicana]